MHFDYPFRFSQQTNHAAENDQDTLDDIAACVVVSILTPLGTRPEVIDFGVPDQVFELQPLLLDTITQAVSTYEPRASLMLDQVMSQQDPLVVQLSAAVSIRKAT
jgi:phage baseplate assembly protein W